MYKDFIKGNLWLPFLFVVFFSQAQVNYSGKSGLLFVPDATEVKDGTFRIGYNYNPKDYALRRNGRNAEQVWYAGLTLLPRLEVTLTILQVRDKERFNLINGIGDRNLDLRYLVLKETDKRPSLAVVMSSPFTIDAALLTHALVSSKNFKLTEELQLTATVGAGSPYFIYRKEDNLSNGNIFSGFKIQKKSEYSHNNGHLVGLFGGVKLKYKDQYGIMAEYDSKYINLGAFAKIGKVWTLQGGLINFDQFMLGSSVSVDLLKSPLK